MFSFKICLSAKDKEALTEFIKDFEFDKDHLTLTLVCGHDECPKRRILSCCKFDFINIFRIIDPFHNEFVRFRVIFYGNAENSSHTRVETMGSIIGWLKKFVSIANETSDEITGFIHEDCADKLNDCECVLLRQ